MLYLLSANKNAAQDFIKNHPFLADAICVKTCQTSHYQSINEILNDKSIGNIACLIHEEVLLPTHFLKSLNQLVETLNCDWPNWGICGNSGTLPFKIGAEAVDYAQYSLGQGEGLKVYGTILPATSLSSSIILLNLKALEKHSVKLPSIENFHLYDLLLSIETQRAGLGVLIAPQLMCYQLYNSFESDFSNTIASLPFKQYLAKIVKDRYIRTLQGNFSLPIPLQPFKNQRLFLQDSALNNAVAMRPRKHLAIIIRSKGYRPKLLQRTINSANYFANFVGNKIECSVCVVTDIAAPEIDSALAKQITHIFPLRENISSRVHLIAESVKRINADYFWFIDDDDWIFPNKAPKLANIIAQADEDSLILIGSQHFKENISDGQSVYELPSYKIEERHYWDPTKWIQSFSGLNHIPFCGMIFSKKMLLDLEWDYFGQLYYLEDYLAQLHCAAKPSCFVYILNELLCGISIRPEGNTVTESNSTKWKQAHIELETYMALKKNDRQTLSVAALLARKNAIEMNQPTVNSATLTYSFDENALILSYRFVKGVGLFLIQPSHWNKRLSLAFTIIIREGTSSLAAKIINFGSAYRSQV